MNTNNPTPITTTTPITIPMIAPCRNPFFLLSLLLLLPSPDDPDSVESDEYEGSVGSDALGGSVGSDVWGGSVGSDVK